MSAIKINLNTSRYKSPTQEDITQAKQFILQRNDYARLLGNKVDECLLDAAQKIVTICYKYDVEPKNFFIASEYNEKMMDEISQVMDEAEEEILSFIYDYSTESVQETATVLGDSSSRKKELLAAWIATLGRKNRNLQETLDGYLFKTMKDVEAAVAALRNAGIALAEAVTKVKSNLHNIYNMPEVTDTFEEAESFNATYIRSRGVEQGAVGLSNSGATNVVNMAKITLQMAWMRQQGIDFDESGAAGYYQLRGSSYPCDICDAEVGFHKGLEDIYAKPYPHPHCCCYRIPIFPTEDNDNDDGTDDIVQARAKFNSYGEEWEKEYFNTSNGGFNVYHKKHQFSNVKPNGAAMSGGQAEKHVGRLLADFGAKQIEFLPENSKGGGKPDIRFDKKKWDVKYIPMANEGTIRKYYKDARKAQAVIFYSETNRDKDVLTAINREKGRFVSIGRDLSELPVVYVMNEDGMLRLLK